MLFVGYGPKISLATMSQILGETVSFGSLKKRVELHISPKALRKTRSVRFAQRGHMCVAVLVSNLTVEITATAI